MYSTGPKYRACLVEKLWVNFKLVKSSGDQIAGLFFNKIHGRFWLCTNLSSHSWKSESNFAQITPVGSTEKKQKFLYS